MVGGVSNPDMVGGVSNPDLPNLYRIHIILIPIGGKHGKKIVYWKLGLRIWTL